MIDIEYLQRHREWTTKSMIDKKNKRERERERERETMEDGQSLSLSTV